MSAVATTRGASYHSTRAFFDADRARERSPEVDYGCWWIEDSRHWPKHRVSWVEATGELYVVRLQHNDAGTVRVLAVIEDRESVERLLDGWAEESEGRLDWLRARVRNHENGGTE